MLDVSLAFPRLITLFFFFFLPLMRLLPAQQHFLQDVILNPSGSNKQNGRKLPKVILNYKLPRRF